MKKMLLAAILSGWPLLFQAQSSQKDSLIKLLPAAKEDSNKAMLYLQIGKAYESNQPDTAKKYYQLAALLSKKINYPRGYYDYLNDLANAFMIQGNLDSALAYQQQALLQAKKMNDSLNIGISLFNIGVNYRERSDFAKAIDYCLQGREIIEKKGSLKTSLQLNDALQLLYFYRTEYDKGIAFGEKALSQARELKFTDAQARCLINLSTNYFGKKMFGKAHEVLEEALKIGIVSGDLRIQATAVQNLGALEIKKQNFIAATTYIEKSLSLCRQIGSADGETIALRGLSSCYLQQGKYDIASDYAQKSLALDRKNNYKREEAMILRCMSAIAYASGDKKKGLEYDDQSREMIETMIKDVLSRQSSDLEKKYETSKKESRIKQLEAEENLHLLRLHQKNIINYSLTAGALTFLVIGILARRTYRQKQKLQQQRITELETEKQLTATEAVLKGEEHERTRLAKDLHDGLGGMLSGIKYSMNTMKGNLVMTPENQQSFERSMDMLDSSIQEMRRVAHNLMPETLVKFGLDTALKDFCNDINQSGALKVNYQSFGMENAAIDQTTAITIYRIVQELINNTMKHAAAKTAIVQLTKTNQQLSVTVEDDGKGFDSSILQQSKGIGWSNIQNRVDFLKGKLDINSTEGKGTSVFIEINV